MLVFMKEKLVLLSVPKTGTTALEAALAARADMVVSNPPELKHAPLYRYNRFFRPMFEKVCNAQMETVAVMREPVSWLGSWYRYRQRPFLDGKPNSTKGLSFNDFVEGYCADPRPAFANVGSQATFLEPRPNGTSVTHLFRYEAQPDLIAFLEDRLQTPISLEQHNVSPAAAGDLDLTSEVNAQLRATHAADFRLYETLLP